MKNGNTDQDIELEVVGDMNERHAAVLVGGKFRIINEMIMPDGTRSITYSSTSDLRGYYKNRCLCKKKAADETKAVNPLDLWLAHENRRQYQGIVFEPGKETPDFYNLWRGFQVEPAPGDVKPYLDHVLNVICDGDEALFRWVADFLADIFKNIGGPLQGSALVTRGRKGTGKGLFVEPLQAILGCHFIPVTGEQEFLGTFNSHTAHAIIIYANEAFWAGRKTAEGALKARITEKTFLMHEKYLPAVSIGNHAHIIMASNEDWVVPASWDERRFCVIDVSDNRRNDHGYFDQMFTWCSKPKNQSALLDFFQNREITSNLRKPPVTGALVEQVERSYKSYERFWLECLYSGRIGGEDTPGPKEFGDWVKSDTIYDEYNTFCNTIKERHPVAKTHLTRKLVDMCPEILRERHTFPDGRVRAVQLPSINTARALYNEKVGYERFVNEKVPF